MPRRPIAGEQALFFAVRLALLLMASDPLVARPQDDACLACHGDQATIQGLAGEAAARRHLYVDPSRRKASVHGSLGCTTCHTTIRDYPHPKRILRVDCAACHAEPSADVHQSAHRVLGAQACASCHGNLHTAQRAARISPEQCATCHADAVRDYKLSVHAQMRTTGVTDAPNCQPCHGPTHKILPASDPASLVAKKNLPSTCGACHANPDFLARHKIPFARPVEAYRLSVHGRAVEAGDTRAPSCSDCHSNHAIFPARDPRAKVNHWNVPAACGSCHSEIGKTYAESVHGQAVARGVPGAPVCTDCHGEHNILAPSEPRSLVNPVRLSSVTCGRCHSDERLVQRYNLPADRVPAFEDSYHGLALRAGSQTVANCASCHGVHNILPSNDPRSTVYPANLARTCGHCHSGAGTRFAIGPVHVLPATASEHSIVKWIRLAYWVLIPLTAGFMLLHNALDFFAKLIRGGARIHSGEQVERLNLHFRIAHWLAVASFPVLVITGFALKFPGAWWAAPVLHWESRFALRGTVHRVAGVILIASIAYHAAHLLVSRRDRVILRCLRPVYQDLLDLVGMLRYNLGLSQERPLFGKFSYAEKIEYLAFVWGSVLMILSGFLLWFDNFTLRYFPKWVADAATAVHYYEAILATLAILVWHFYLVMFDPDVYPMDLAWLTGKTSADHLRHTRAAYYLSLVSHAATSTSPEPQKASATPEGEPGREAAEKAPSSQEQAPPKANEQKKPQPPPKERPG